MRAVQMLELQVAAVGLERPVRERDLTPVGREGRVVVVAVGVAARDDPLAGPVGVRDDDVPDVGPNPLSPVSNAIQRPLG